ncbi:phytanoyl-CoA dioxygenase family protein [Streptomyces sp. AM 2-1-1]|uniref:phytanoyl-CoA dioxygenase family protein n=1 Tax=Streptomyces sp. AM 2-1-1 TaxID=3028709 RepID=UPI0023B8950B|nr:phytanoyl-CoA dioxygenase family protein [Streptomyces sp. AM 2-1-1]WEH40970.1 phytanoyl-CoA dioxygenase family protein [Streptomyces sp. AM 2-1-1]
MSLTTEDKATFKRDGVLIRRGLATPDHVRQAISVIAKSYREGMAPEDIPAYSRRTFTPELGDSAELLSLYTQTGAAGLAADLLGATAPILTAQVQIRVPEAEFPGVQQVKAMHVDGVSCPHLDPQELRTFSLLVGVVLSDINEPRCGALHYLPGGHITMARWFSEEWSLGVTDQVPPEIDSEDGTAFLGRPGDVLLMHHLVPHTVGQNLKPFPRVMAYFRVSHPDHAGRRLEALRDPWLDYPPLADLPFAPDVKE